MNKNHKRKRSLSIHNQLTSYQWAIIRRMNLNQLLHYYREQDTIITQKDFFSNIKHSTLENMLRLVFGKEIQHSTEEKQIYLQIISILKEGKGLIQFLIKEPHFNRDIIFGFLDESPISDTTLRIFGEIFMNFARGCPNKLMSVIKDEKIQYLFTKNMKISEIFKVVYTMIFCLNKKTSNQEHSFICAVIYSLLFVIFQNDAGDSIFDPNYWSCGQQKNKQKQAADNNIGESCCDSPSNRFSTKENEDYFNVKLKPFFSTKQLEEFTEKLVKNTQTFFEQNIEVVENISFMIEEVSKNLSEIEKRNVEIMVDIIMEQMYISKIFTFLNLIRNSIVSLSENAKQKEKYVQTKFLFDELESSVYNLLYNIVMMHESFQNNSKEIASSRNISDIDIGKKQKVSSFGEIIEKINLSHESEQCIQEKIETEARIKRKLSIIIKQINLCVMNQWSETRVFSKIFEIRLHHISGLSVRSMKMSRLWVIKILAQIMELSQHGQSYKIIQQGINQTSRQIFYFLQEIIKINKWNNIIQNQFFKLFQQFLANKYANFIQLIKEEPVELPENMLGIIITNFRNKNHFFLNTMNVCTQGDQHFLYQLGKYISGTLSQRNDLKSILQKYPAWKDFIHKDLKNYESIYSKQHAFSDEAYDQPQLAKCKSTSEQLPIDEPLQTIHQIIEDLQMNMKWRSSDSPPKLLTRRRKQSFNSFEAIKQIDSLRNFQLNGQK